MRAHEGWEAVLLHLVSPGDLHTVPGVLQDHGNLLQPGPGHLTAPQPQPGLRGEGVWQVLWTSHPVNLPQVRPDVRNLTIEHNRIIEFNIFTGNLSKYSAQRHEVMLSSGWPMEAPSRHRSGSPQDF